MAEHEHKDEHKEHEHKEKKDQVTIKKSTVKMASVAIVMLIIGLVAGYAAASMLVKPQTPATTADSTAIGKKVVDYLNKNIVQPGTTASFVSAKEENGLIVVTTLYQGQEIPLYTDKSGIMVFLSSPEFTNETIPTAETQPTEIAKTDKPSVDLYVMSFCPYGVQAENIMKPVVDLLGSKADIKVRFIASVAGNTSDSVQSLHGANEAMEDLRQVCIMKYYPDKYWSYLMDINQNCYSNFRDAAALETCWKAAATKLGMDTAKIDTCSKGQEGLALLKADEQLTDTNGVSGSPTIIINGAKYNGARSSEAFEQAICNAFVTPPSECGTIVAGGQNTTAPAGGCG